MVALRLTLLGGFDARLSAGGAVSVPTKKAQALLAYLGLRPGEAHQRDKLAALLWGERSDAHARDGLRHALGALWKTLLGVEPPSLLVEGQTLALNPVVVEVDVATFERWARDASIGSVGLASSWSPWLPSSAAGSTSRYCRQALALAEPRGMRPLVAHCHLGLGKLYRRMDKREQAQEHLATATAMYREMLRRTGWRRLRPS